MLREGGGTGLTLDPLDPRNGGVEYQAGAGRHLRPDAVAWDQRDTVPSSHVGTLPDRLVVEVGSTQAESRRSRG